LRLLSSCPIADATRAWGDHQPGSRATAGLFCSADQLFRLLASTGGSSKN
jgi:hypothetical protein